MNAIDTIVTGLSSEEQEQFIQYLRKKNKRSDHKNIQLFKLLTESNNSSSELCEKLYGNKNKGAYHALRKRLYRSLVNFTAQLNLDNESSSDMQTIKYLLAARSFFLRHQPKIGHDLLKKAEVMASDEQNYPVLNEIFHTQIQYAHTSNSIDLQSSIEKFQANQLLHQSEEQLNIAYAKVRQALINYNYKGQPLDFQSLFENILSEQNISFDDSMSLKSLYQLMALSSMTASVDKNYANIEHFLISNYKRLRTHRGKEKHLYYHIEIVYMIANMLFRTKKFRESGDYLDIMRELMQQGKRTYYRRFRLKFSLLKALNLNYTGHPQEAIDLLSKALIQTNENLETELDVKLTLTMCYFQQHQLEDAKNLYATFYHTDKYYIERAGQEWVIKKNLMEILLHIELEHLDLAESRIRSFKRSYKNYLKKMGESRVISYLNLAEYYFKHPETVTGSNFRDKVEQAFDWKPLASEDIFVMSFYAWLKSKMMSRPIYDTTLDLIKRSQAVN